MIAHGFPKEFYLADFDIVHYPKQQRTEQSSTENSAPHVFVGSYKISSLRLGGSDDATYTISNQEQSSESRRVISTSLPIEALPSQSPDQMSIILAEAEVLKVACSILDSIPNAPPYYIIINHYHILDCMLDVCLPEDSSEDMKSRVSNIISSFGKWPWSLVNDKLIEIGLDSTLVEHLKKFVSHKGAPKRELSQIGSLFLQLAKDRPHVYAKARRAINHLIQLLATLDDFAVPSNRLSFDASLSSTKEYRSGLVFQVVVVVSEAQVKRHCVALGGRYDDIITDFRSQIPRAPNEDHGNFGCAQAVGLSIAIEKLISIVKRPQETSERVRTADVYVIAEDNLRSAKLQMLSRLWDHNLKTDYIHNPELSLHDQKKKLLCKMAPNI